MRKIWQSIGKKTERKRKAKVLSEQTLNSSTASDISTISDESPYRNRQSYGKAIKKKWKHYTSLQGKSRQSLWVWQTELV